jgi:hypothetical protein
MANGHGGPAEARDVPHRMAHRDESPVFMCSETTQRTRCLILRLNSGSLIPVSTLTLNRPIAR